MSAAETTTDRAAAVLENALLNAALSYAGRARMLLRELEAEGFAVVAVDGRTANLLATIKAADEAPDMDLGWLTSLSTEQTEEAFAACGCVLGRCVDRRYPDAVCEHVVDDYRQEVVRLRRLADRIGATNIRHLSQRYRAICRDYGRASKTIADLRGRLARRQVEATS